MYLEILDFLMEKRYVELSDWSKGVLELRRHKIAPDQIKLLTFLKNKEFDDLLTHFRKMRYTAKHNEAFIIALENLEKNKQEITAQWDFAKTIREDTDFINIILDQDILVYQRAIRKEKGDELELKKIHQIPPQIKSKEEFSQAMKSIHSKSSNPQNVFFQGKLYKTAAMSNTNKLQAVYNNSLMKEDLRRYKKYEKIVRFIDNLNLPLQNLFSKNQIGIVIFQQKIYLIKWVKYLNEEQLLSGKVQSQSQVSIIKNFGIKIGVELKENLNLGDLVVFKSREEEDIENNRELMLSPLLSLDQRLFSRKEQEETFDKNDLSDPKNSKIFVERVLDRIEMGILLLTKGKSKSVKSNEDLDIYVKISMQKVSGIDSTNQRINVLRELLSINKNPDNDPEIKEKLEKNYILLLKELFQMGNTKRVPELLQELRRLDLFDENVGLLLQTIVFLVDSHYMQSKDILLSIELLEKQWDLTPEQYKLLEKPQISAITNVVIAKLNKGEFSSVLSYLNDYIESHPNFGTFNILTLINEILIEIFRKKYQLEDLRFTNDQYINFLSNFADMIESHDQSMDGSQQKKLKDRVNETISLLTRDIDFITYIDDKVFNFLSLLKDFNSTYISDKLIFEVVQSFVDLIPLAIFRNVKPKLGLKFLTYLIDSETNPKILLKYLTNYVEFFRKSSEKLRKNPAFFEESCQVLFEFRKIMDSLNINKVFLLPFKKEINSFLRSWYLEKNLPESTFSLHRKLIEDWIDLTKLKSEFKKMINILSIKDLIWTAQQFNVSLFQEKYSNLPASIFEEDVVELRTELTNFLGYDFKNEKEIKLLSKAFELIHQDYHRMELNPLNFDPIVKTFIDNIIQSCVSFISQGNHDLFDKTLIILGEHQIYFTPNDYKKIQEKFVSIYRMELGEGQRFNLRIKMMVSLSTKLRSFLKDYEGIRRKYEKFVSHRFDMAKLSFLERFYNNLMESSYEVFQQAQKWLMFVSKNEFLTYDKAYQPMKNLFTTMLQQFSGKKKMQILEELKDLSYDIFQKQTMLNENKKNYFKMMKKVLPDKEYPEFHETFKKYNEYIKELSDIESLYYTIEGTNNIKITALRERLEDLIENFEHLFNVWFIYGNILALQENFEKAIEVYNRALGYELNQPVSSRLYHNLIISYVSTGRMDEAIKLIKSLDVGIRTTPTIRDLISRIEEKMGMELQQSI